MPKRKDPKDIFVNDLNTTLSDAIKKMSKKSIGYSRHYGDEMNKFLTTPAVKGLLKTKAETMSISQIKEQVRKKLNKVYPNFTLGKMPIKCIDGKIRHYKPDPWCFMVSRTASRDFREMGLHQEMAKAGLDLVTISVGGSNDPCRNWEGKVLSITGETPGYDKISDVRATGEIWHPNCVHSTSPFMLYEDETGEIGVLGRDMKDYKMVRDKFGHAIATLRKKAETTAKKIVKEPAKSSELNMDEKKILRLKELDAIQNKEQAEEWGKKWYPNVAMDFTGISDINIPKTIVPTLRELERLNGIMPYYVKELNYLGTYRGKAGEPYKALFGKSRFHGEWAHAVDYGGRKWIALSPGYYNNPKKYLEGLKYSVEPFKRRMEYNPITKHYTLKKIPVTKPWHPYGCDSIESVMTHEFGHHVNNVMLKSKAAINPVIGLEGYEQVANGKVLFRRNNNTSILSEYALKSKAEGFAEAFSSHFHTPKSKKTDYAIKMNKFLKMYGDPKNWHEGYIFSDEYKKLKPNKWNEYVKYREKFLKDVEDLNIDKPWYQKKGAKK